MELSDDRFARSRSTSSLLQRVVPGGAHTYAKGDDQFPEGLAPIISHGRGGHVWDVDGNEYIEYGSGLRSVSLGHAHPKVIQAVRRNSAAAAISSGRASSRLRPPNGSWRRCPPRRW